jgi:dipeptidyl aminopeptidase Ste13
MADFKGTNTGYSRVSGTIPEEIHESVPMEDLLRRDSTQSQVSELFEHIDDMTSKGFDSDKPNHENFHKNPTFQIVLAKYHGKGPISRLVWMVAGCILFAVWFIGLLVYSNGKVTHIASSLTWQTNVSFAGHEIALNEYNPQYSNITLNHFRKGVYYPALTSVSWFNAKQYPTDAKIGGYYLTEVGNKMVIKQIRSDYTKVVLSTPQISYKNDFFYVRDIKLNPGISIDQQKNYHILVSDIARQWRHLTFAIYWLYDTESASYTPIQPSGISGIPSQSGNITKLNFAEFSPSGKYVVFGSNNDLYIQTIENNEVHRITDTGSANILNGRADWVYEEEIFGGHNMFWWSPDETHLMFTTLNDTLVQDFDLEYYMKQPSEGDDGVDDFNLYPRRTTIKYPKPGTAIPEVSLQKFNVDNKTTTKIDLDEQEFLLYDAIWTDSNNFLIKITDRASRVMTKLVYHHDKSDKFNKVSVLNATQQYNGWFEGQTPMVLIPMSENVAYVDKVVVDGRTHLALFANATASTYTKLLTQGNWDVLHDSKVAYDTKEKFVYAFASVRSSMDSHMIGIDVESGRIYNITSDEIDGFYEGEFSDDGQYCDLHYKGPSHPWQRLINMGDIHDRIEDQDDKNNNSSDNVIQQSKPINNLDLMVTNLKNTNIPTKSYLQIKVGTYDDNTPITLNVIEILPPNFTPNTKKYPLLVYAYGGPGSQTVDKQFSIDFQDVASASLDAIVLIIDPRGTGGKDWRFAAFATDNLGYWEPRDITTVTAEYISKNSKSIDSNKVGIWGWSYGGFTTLKTLEYDAGKTFKFGVAVAPVTNWLFYDSVYTERYLNTPDHSNGYDGNGKIKNYENFNQVKRFMILHGTSDDNVHLQNLMWLLDKFNVNNVENYDVHFFPDSDHSIQFHNAHSIVYDKILNWWKDGFTGKFDALYRL